MPRKQDRFFKMESALRGTQRNTPFWSLLVLLKALLVSPHICSQIHILISFYANIVHWVFSAVSSVDDYLKTLLSTRMLLFAQCFSGYFCSGADIQICFLQGRECTVNLFPLPQSAAVKSSFSQRLRTTHRGGDLTFGKPRWCLDGSLWYVWHQRSTILPCTWTLSTLWLQQQMGVWTQTSSVTFTEVFGATKMVFQFHFAFGT